MYCRIYRVFILALSRGAPTYKTTARTMMAIVNISHPSQFLEYSHEEYWVSLLVILSTVILLPPNLRLIANPFAFNSHNQSFNTINNARQIKKSDKRNFVCIDRKTIPYNRGNRRSFTLSTLSLRDALRCVQDYEVGILRSE